MVCRNNLGWIKSRISENLEIQSKKKVWNIFKKVEIKKGRNISWFQIFEGGGWNIKSHLIQTEKEIFRLQNTSNYFWRLLNFWQSQMDSLSALKRKARNLTFEKLHKLVGLLVPLFSQAIWFNKEGPSQLINVNYSASPSVTASFQHQLLWLKKHEITHTRDEPFGHSQCDWLQMLHIKQFDKAWKNPNCE